MDKGGNFIGWLFTEGINLSVALVEEGLSKVHFTAERSNYYQTLLTAETNAKKGSTNVSIEKLLYFIGLIMMKEKNMGPRVRCNLHFVLINSICFCKEFIIKVCYIGVYLYIVAISTQVMGDTPRCSENNNLSGHPIFWQKITCYLQAVCFMLLLHVFYYMFIVADLVISDR